MRDFLSQNKTRPSHIVFEYLGTGSPKETLSRFLSKFREVDIHNLVIMEPIFAGHSDSGSSALLGRFSSNDRGSLELRIPWSSTSLSYLLYYILCRNIVSGIIAQSVPFSHWRGDCLGQGNTVGAQIWAI